jgi:ethanolamine utilization microcompartment shell protein EutS
MTSQSPRIYLYKITFEEVPYYYYGVHKEKYFNDVYWGSPKTNKWCWEFYTPKKQILQFFDYTDEGWLEANNIEKRIIKPVLNNKWCLNEGCGGVFSEKICRKNGLRHKENNTGFFSIPREKRVEISKKNGYYTYENNIGCFSLTEEERKKVSSEVGLKVKEKGIGIFGLTKEQMTEYRKMGAQKVKELGVSIYALTPEERSEISKKVAYQKWKCLETGFVANAGNLTQYQRKRGIDTSKRVRIE